MAVMHRRGLVAEHRRRGDGGNAAPGRPAGDDVEPAGERRLFPTVHKAGQPGVGPMSGDAVAAMIQRRAAAAGYTPTQVNLLGGHLLRSGFVTEAFRAGDERALDLAADRPPGSEDARGLCPGIRPGYNQT